VPPELLPPPQPLDVRQPPRSKRGRIRNARRGRFSNRWLNNTAVKVSSASSTIKRRSPPNGQFIFLSVFGTADEGAIVAMVIVTVEADDPPTVTGLGDAEHVEDTGDPLHAIATD
jgi:hypothetical protein